MNVAALCLRAWREGKTDPYQMVHTHERTVNTGSQDKPVWVKETLEFSEEEAYEAGSLFEAAFMLAQINTDKK